MSKVKAWFLLFRPWSYTATLVPFLFALALTGSSGGNSLIRWAVGLLSGMLFQATVNLLNTWGDERSGVDNVPGAIRTTPQVHEGLVSMRAVFTTAAICAVVAVALGLGLVFHEGPCWSLLGAGVLGALGATNYSTGIKFKYRGLGVPFVAVLMGPLETFVAFAILNPSRADACMLGLLRLEPFDVFTALAFLFLTFPIAALVCIIMHGNDMRDIPTDRAAGIKTVASILGPRRALWLYWFCHVGAYLPPLAMAVYDRFFGCGDLLSFSYLLPLLVLPLTAKTLRAATKVYRENPECPKWRGLERGSGGVHFAFGLLYALAFRLTLW